MRGRTVPTSLFMVLFWLLSAGSLITISSAQTSALPAQTSSVPASVGGSVPLMPGISIILYVNSADKEHFETVVKRALYLRDTDPRVRLTSIFHVGDYRHVSPEIEDALRKRAIYFGGLPAIPKNIAAATSPTWVIRTASTDHIVEGPIPLEDCLDKQGAYQEPTVRQKAVVPSPTPRVKEF